MAMTRISLTGDKHKEFHPGVQDWAAAATYPAWLRRLTSVGLSNRECNGMQGEFIRNESRFRNWVTAREEPEHGVPDGFYAGSHKSLNPTGIVPKGPEIDFNMPHCRDQVENKPGAKNFTLI